MVAAWWGMGPECATRGRPASSHPEGPATSFPATSLRAAAAASERRTRSDMPAPISRRCTISRRSLDGLGGPAIGCRRYDPPLARAPTPSAAMIVRSRSADVTVPDVSITEYVMRQARRLGDKPAIIEGPTGRVVTYRELDEAIR